MSETRVNIFVKLFINRISAFNGFHTVSTGASIIKTGTSFEHKNSITSKGVAFLSDVSKSSVFLRLEIFFSINCGAEEDAFRLTLFYL